MVYRREKPTPEEEIARIRIPKENEILGVALEMLGAGKLRVECSDGKTRLCRIPGRLRKRVWVRPGDLVIVEPWSVQGNERGDIIWRYTKTQGTWLKKKGYVKNITYG